ncbi:Uncharacterised protein [Vibrio cholerae]|nr:Uncharacterised protein [Vibrio cholerae]
MKYLVSLLNHSAGRTGLMISSITASRRSAVEIESLC